MTQSVETQAKIQLFRQKAREGTLTQDDMREAIILMRGDRERAASVSATSRTKKAVGKVKVNSDDLLSELDNI